MANVPDLADNAWASFTLPFVVTLAFSEIGFRWGLRSRLQRDEDRRSTIGSIQAAVLGLLGLLLGFTFAMAAQRYDARRELVLKEANTIGTTYLRASLLPDAHVAPVQDLLRRYVAVRVAYYPRVDDPAVVREAMARSMALQQALWQHAVDASREAPTAITATFVDSLNETIDTDSERIAAGRARVPPAVWLLLLIVASLGCLTTSYLAGVEGARSVFSSVVLPVLIAIVLVLIFDIANPHNGIIGISQQPMEDLLQSIGPPTGPG